MPLDDRKTGLGWYIFRFVKTLAQVNPPMEITIFAFKNDRVFFDEIDLPQGWELRIVPAFFSRGIFNLCWIWWISMSLPGKYDEVYYPALNRRAPLCFSNKNTGCLMDLGEYHFSKKYTLARNLYVKKILSVQSRHVRSIFAISAATRADIIKYYNIPGERVVINHLGPDDNAFYPVEQEKAKRRVEKYFPVRSFLLYVSRLEHPAKNHVFLVELFDLLKKEGFSDLQLVFIGSRWNNWQDVYKLMEQSKYREDIYHFEDVDQKDMKHFYSAADCYVHPSLWEGFGYPVVEAMYCGTPVLVARNSSLVELIPSGEFSFADSNEAREKVKQILCNKQLAGERGESCREYAHRFSMKAHIQRFLNFVKEKD